MNKVAIALLIFVMTGCCTKVDCSCEDLQITIKPENKEDFNLPDELNSFSLVMTDEQFHRQDSSGIFFEIEYGYTVDEETNPALGRIEDHNFLLRNAVSGSIDTISDITNIRSDSAFKCNDCFLKKDYKHCPVLREKKLKLNGELIDSYTVVIKK